MSIRKEAQATKLFRESTGLPINSSVNLHSASIACCVEESAETIDGMQDMLVTYIGAALQTTDDDKSDILIDYCDRILDAMALLSFSNEFSRSEVLAANLSKLCSSIEEAADTVSFYADLGIQCESNNVGHNLYSINCAQDVTVDGKFYPKGKLLKNVNWREPVFNAENFPEWFKGKDILKLFGYEV